MSRSQPWMKFYPSDWRSDPKLKLCSLGARGLWVECMCLMHEAETYGHLSIDGNGVTEAELAALVGTNEEVVRELLAELERRGVFSRNRSGVIFSRRMTRDFKKIKTAQKNGQNGGNPTLCKQKDIRPSDKGGVKGGVKAQIPEAREQIPEEKKKEGSEAKASGAAAPGQGGLELATVDGEPAPKKIYYDLARQIDPSKAFVQAATTWLQLHDGDAEAATPGLMSCQGKEKATPYLWGAIQDLKARNKKGAKSLFDAGPDPRKTNRNFTGKWGKHWIQDGVLAGAAT